MPTLEQIRAKIKTLQAQADALIAKKAQAAVDEIRKIMLAHGLTTADIEAKAKAKRDAKAAIGNTLMVKEKTVKSIKGSASPKYQHPKTGATWTGHGRAPAWIANVKDRTKFLIAGITNDSHAAGVSTANTVSKAKSATKKAAMDRALSSKGQRKGPQPAKYLNPKTGATWSGRGPAPAWLAAVKDRASFLVDGAESGKTQVKSAKLPGKKASAKTVAKKKTTAAKPAAKKAPIARNSAKKVSVNATPTSAAKKTPTTKASRKNAAASTPAAVVETSVGSTT